MIEFLFSISYFLRTNTTLNLLIGQGLDGGLRGKKMTEKEKKTPNYVYQDSTIMTPVWDETHV